MKIKKVLAFFLLAFVPSLTCYSYWVWSPESGKFVNPEGAAQDTVGEQYDYAMSLYEEGKVDDAIDQLKNLLKNNRGAKTAPEAQYRLGTMLEEKNDYYKAFKAYQVILESYPQSDRINEVIERSFRIGNLFLSGQKAKLLGLEVLPSLPKAVEIFQSIVDKAPFSDFGDQAQFRLGLTYKKWGRYDEAVEAFEKLINDYPRSDLVAQARFQVAETAYVKSNVAMRDQRALDSAAGHLDNFLDRYPDSTASEKASKLRQEIDEKNAEKNYRIAAYYEKTNYLESAMIYYEDVSKRYPHTRWGQKAAEKISSLKEPVLFLREREKETQAEIDQLEARLQSAVEKGSIEEGQAQRQLERMRERLKSIDKTKTASLKSREDDISRRESELKQKYKNLDKKKKLLEKNESEDLRDAILRWEASLRREGDDLALERQQLEEWKTSFGMEGGGAFDWVPFIGEGPTDVEKVRSIDSRKLFKVAEEKKGLLSEKELLYKQQGEVRTQLTTLRRQALGIADDQGAFLDSVASGNEDFALKQEKVESGAEQIKALEIELEAARKEYQSKYGKGPVESILEIPSQVVRVSGEAMQRLNPFSSQRLEDKTVEQLQELESHTAEKVRNQEQLVRSLSEAFNDELAGQEQRRLMESLQGAESADPRQIRKTIKNLEKEIRSAYEEIADRDERKTELVHELDALMKQDRQGESSLGGAGRVVTAPVRGIVRGTKNFLFGKPSKDQEVMEDSLNVASGDSALSAEARRLREQIELESLLIDAKHWEIRQLQIELEAAQAQASMAGGFKFRSSIVDVPYAFIGNAIENARKIVPKKDRSEVIVSQIDRETSELKGYREELDAIRSELVSRGKKPAVEETVQPKGEARVLDEWINELKDESEPAAAAETQATPVSEQEKAEEAALQARIRDLEQRLHTRQAMYEKEKSLLLTEIEAFMRETSEHTEKKDWTKQDRKIQSRSRDLKGELEGIERDIVKLIEKENELQESETGVLEKRIEKIDLLVQKAVTRTAQQDLLNERQKLVDQLDQLKSREKFLTQELEQFQLSQAKTAT